MESVTKGLTPEAALAEYRRLLARDDLAGQPWAAVLRNERAPVTVLYSRFDLPEQRLLPSDAIDLNAAIEAVRRGGADEATREIVAARA